MEAEQKILTRLQEVISEHLGVRQEEIARDSTWAQLGADSLDRLGLSLAFEDAFKVDIPHYVGERLNTVGDTLDFLLSLIAAQGGLQCPDRNSGHRSCIGSDIRNPKLN